MKQESYLKHQLAHVLIRSWYIQSSWVGDLLKDGWSGRNATLAHPPFHFRGLNGGMDCRMNIFTLFTARVSGCPREEHMLRGNVTRNLST